MTSWMPVVASIERCLRYRKVFGLDLTPELHPVELNYEVEQYLDMYLSFIIFSIRMKKVTK